MSKKGRILIVDDTETWREQLVETLQRAGFQAEAVSCAADALEQLHTTLYHVLVLDIRMDDTDLSNVGGIDLLKELGRRGLTEVIKVIMLSAYGTEDQTRMAFREYDVADFLSKAKFNNQAILEAVQQVFSKDANINLALEIHWQRSEPMQAVLNLAIAGTPIKRNSPLQTQVAEELEDLLCRLFKNAQSVMVRPLTPGRSGTAVLAAQPFFTTGGAGRECIVKFGDIRKVEEEYENFKKYVQPFVGGGRNTTVIDRRYTQHLGGIVYSLLGTSKDRLKDFGEFYRQTRVPQITKALDRLFWDTCGNWYANPGDLRPVDLTAHYQRLLHYSPERLEQIRSELLKPVQEKQKLYSKTLKEERGFPNPLLATMDQKFVRSTYVCTTHGDFNSHNLLVDSTGHVWLIDFQGTGQSHILRDIVMLDAVVRFQLLAASDATLEECLQMEEILCGLNSFSQIEHLPPTLPTENPALAKAYSTIVYLHNVARKLVSRNPNDDISEYFIALFYNAINTLSFDSLPAGQREHALLCASLLADKLCS